MGFDSCGIFFIGGFADIKLRWDLASTSFLTAKGAELEKEYQGKKLDVYDGQNYPGQPWKAYRSRGFKEKDQEKNLEKHMTALLEKSTTVKELDELPYRGKYCPYLRLNQKEMSQKVWMGAEGMMHNGAHFPLCVHTNNARARAKQSGRRTPPGKA